MAKSKLQPIPPDSEANEPGETQRAQPTLEEIATRAYHIYLERGGGEGSPQDDWLQAERELTNNN